MDVSKGTTAYLLREVKALLEKGWIKNALVEDSEGHVTSVLSSEACKFCMAGAALHTTGRYAAAHGVPLRIELRHDRVLKIAIANAIKRYAPHFNGNIPAFNDAKSTKLEDVLKVMDMAIAESEIV